MEFFTKSKAVKLRSHLDKYLIADDDREKVRQSRNGSSRRAMWVVEAVEGKNRHVRLKSCHGRYLTATDLPFLLGMTGKTVIQGDFDRELKWRCEWEVVREGFQVRMKSWCWTYLRGNGGTPPWRNSITHDEPYASATQNWILWTVEPVKSPENLESVSSWTSASSDEASIWDPESPCSVFSMMKSPMRNSKLQTIGLGSCSSEKSIKKSGMEFFAGVKVVRLRSHHEKFLVAEADEETVSQERNGSFMNARWTVEPVPEYDFLIRLKSCYGKYLTASSQGFLLGVTGRKVVQTLPARPDSSVEWEPIREWGRVKLKTRYGNFLRANGGLPPWRNSVTHDIPQRTATQDWVLWDVDVVEILPPPRFQPHSPTMDFDCTITSPRLFPRQVEWNDGIMSSPTGKRGEGRTIFYRVASEEDDKIKMKRSNDVEEDEEEYYRYSKRMMFKGSQVDELSRQFEQETGIQGVIVCTRSPLNGNLYPLRLHLPPNNLTMHLLLVLPSSKLARDLERQGLL